MMDEGRSTESKRSLGRGWAWGLGVIAPVVLLVFDPLIFSRGRFIGTPYLAAWKPFSFVAIALGVTVLAYALSSRRPHAGVTGVLYASALFAAVLGLALLPLSAVGLLIGIGAFGLLPFVVAYVHYAWAQHCRATLRPGRRLWTAGFLLYFALAGAVQVSASSALDHAIEQALRGEPQALEEATARLRFWAPLLDFDRFAAAWIEAPEGAGRERLAALYLDVVGKDLSGKLLRFRE